MTATTHERAPVLDGHAAFESLVRAIERSRDVAAGNLWGASQALILANLARRVRGPWLAVCSSELEVDALADDLQAFGLDPFVLPAREEGGTGGDGVRARLGFAQTMAGPADRHPSFVLASQVSLLQPLPAAADLEGRFLHLAVKQRLNVEDLIGRLVAAGYTRQPLAERPGELSLRGDILDIYPFASELPLRIELFDAEIESLRSFDPETQRSIEAVPRISVCLASDAGGIEDGRGVLPSALMAAGARVVEIEPLRLADQRQGLAVRSSAHAHALEREREELAKRRRLSLQSLPAAGVSFDTRSVQALAVGLERAPAELKTLVEAGQRVRIYCRGEVERKRLAERFAEFGAGLEDVELELGELSKGFRLLGANLIVVAQHELAGLAAAEHRRAERTPHRVRALRSFFELKIGDLVVHAVHGLAIYRGLSRMARGGGEEEHLWLEFADEVSLFVPATRVDLVQRYIGTGSASPPLDKIGSQSFRRRKEKVERALVDLAGDLLELAALREARKRPAWTDGAELVSDMRATFPHEDTPDQATATVEIDGDLTGERPMDRLLCGDVGFGKTELAMRAAFRVVAAGGQVAVLVPTTVLCEQHLETFRQRLLGFPVRIEEISRLTSPKEARERLGAAAAGRVDILIGTHRILSKDVSFARLGLVVIDEEQRFGVKHKEHLKHLRAQVDVLTMTATPIPRTLHMSLSGVRDISALTMPPLGRQEVETIIAHNDERKLIRDVLLREKVRGGKVFYLHNRVSSIERFTDDLRALVPESSFVVGHGQMDPHELARVMARFSHGEADVLVSTTIVENGIDIPAAGTILIDEADRFGLAELHQLRGRVGRGRQKAWCYLLLDRARPLRGAARDRIKALEELTHLGAGFQISMKDLEIRGAGNLLGAEQSGHIAAIGYDMYCRLLKQTIERLQSGSSTVDGFVPVDLLGDAESVELELGVVAYLPASWVRSSDERLELLRSFDSIGSRADAKEAEAALRDRYGRVPPEALELLRLFALRRPLVEHSVRRLAFRGDSFLVEFSDRVALEGLFGGRGLELRPLRAGVALLVLPKNVQTPSNALIWLEGLLHPTPATSNMGA